MECEVVKTACTTSSPASGMKSRASRPRTKSSGKNRGNEDPRPIIGTSSGPTCGRNCKGLVRQNPERSLTQAGQEEESENSERRGKLRHLSRNHGAGLFAGASNDAVATPFAGATRDNTREDVGGSSNSRRAAGLRGGLGYNIPMSPKAGAIGRQVH